VAGPAILCVACGHFRELASSDAVAADAVARVVGLDQDEEALSCVRRWAGSIKPLELQSGSPLHLIVGENDLGAFDLVYSPGLYDYLDQPMARRLSRTLFSMLKPGGTLLLANFLKETSVAASIELFMDWWLIYRTEAEIRDFTAEIPPAEIGDAAYWSDGLELGYLRLKRA
jgi:extracellular factor (EF) 3-hydroxypalmitic acid methyl ester biosynthesis protein